MNYEFVYAKNTTILKASAIFCSLDIINMQNFENYFDTIPKLILSNCI